MHTIYVHHVYIVLLYLFVEIYTVFGIKQLHI